MPRRPNILFLMSDDHAPAAIGAYGSVLTKTPHLDRLAREGVRFDRAFCVNSLCGPSRATVLSGTYNHVNGFTDNSQTFDPAQATFPRLLQGAGYETAIVGKWHLKTPANPCGFDYSCVLPGQGAYFDPPMLENGAEVKLSGHTTDVITEKALAWLDGRSSDKPYCLLLNHKAPHANWEVPERHAALFEDVDLPLPESFDDDYATRCRQIAGSDLKVGPYLWKLHYAKRCGPIPEHLGAQEARRWVYQRFVKDYLRCVAGIDESLGRVLALLEKKGVLDDTLVVYTADHGFFLGEHGLYDKRFMYEHAIRIPLLMRYPRAIPAGHVQRAMALNADYAQTLLDFAGVPAPARMQGRSLKQAAASGAPADWRSAWYYRFYEQGYGIGPHEGLRTERHKLIRYLYGDEGWELFDLEQDPNEMRNLYGRPEAAELTAQLKAEMERQKESLGA